MARVASAGNETSRHRFVQPDHADLKLRVDAALERLSQLLMSGTAQGPRTNGGSGDSFAAEADRIARMTRFLGQVRAAWVELPENALPALGAGLGSTVVVEDLDHGVQDRYTLMTGALLDIDSDQVSLASPIGHALLGARSGDSLVVDTPQRRRRLRVVEVRTLHDLLDDEVPPRLPAA